MESAHQLSFRPDCHNTADVPSFHSAHCSLSNPICFRSVWCRRSMIPGKIFTSPCQIPRNCKCNMTFGFLFGSQNYSQAPLCFQRSFCFARIRLDPLGGLSPAPRLHIDDCVEIHTLHWELCDLLWSNHQNFLHEVRLCQCVFCTGPLWFWSSGRSRNFGLSGSEYKHCVHPNPHVSQALKVIREKNLRESLCVQELCHAQDSLWILAAFPVFRNGTGLPVLARGPHFYLVFGFFWLADALLGSRRTRVSPFLPFHTFTWHNCGMVIYPARVSPFLSIHTFAWHSWRCHGWWGRRAWGRLGMINFLPWSCHGCWRRQARGRTCSTIGTKLSGLHSLYPNTVFKWDVVFDRWSTRMSIHIHRKAFLAIRLLAYPRGLSLSRIYPILWHKLWPLHVSALHHWLL